MKSGRMASLTPVEGEQPKQRTFERLLAPNQWKIIEGIKVENTTSKMRRVIITIPEEN